MMARLNILTCSSSNIVLFLRAFRLLIIETLQVLGVCERSLFALVHHHINTSIFTLSQRVERNLSAGLQI
jgi:hypothetical protein